MAGTLADTDFWAFDGSALACPLVGRPGARQMNRRSFLASALASTALPVLAQPVSAPDFVDTARQLARLPHRDPAMVLPPPFDALTYDSYRAIRAIPNRAGDLALGNKVVADLFPPGFYFQDAVGVEIETDDGLQTIPYDPELFTYADRYFDAPPQLARDITEGMGFSGIRLRGPFRTPDKLDEFIAIQGASYFRAVSLNTLYGLSARALALGTGGPAPEEFPVFTRLRLSRVTGDQIRIDALIESPSVTGSMTLKITPGEPTVTDIDAVIFPRTTLATVGIAPLTSMYLKGPVRASVSDEFRPAVHDSDALKILNGAGEAIWRPLTNPATLQTSLFQDGTPKGFGLIQSQRTFADFEDQEALYHRRPSAWVEPKGDWGPGSIVLVEIPTGDEFMDNIVAFWRPAHPLEAGGEYRFAYRILWGNDPVLQQAHQLQVVQTRSGRVHDQPGHLQYIVDFASLPRRAVVLDLSSSAGTLYGASAYPLEGRGHLRVGFRFDPSDTSVAELRLVLRDPDGSALSDVWLHRWSPARDGDP